ncbi:DUF2777 family protein [Halalkalibacterium ligniniphilum]|uniref:DUF2777 family protein n=1 Tax=Halalkalibacterium ligniniphilum TaxID=1134413 RepID=UPI00034547DA|nr:DUF2777 family protein [Halalkalibacterium ligniniphilum]
MDRKKAQTLIGTAVTVHEGNLGSYFGELLEVHAEPRKTWVGTVKILGIATFPTLSLDDEKTSLPLYKEGEIIQCSGSKIKPSEAENVEDIEYKRSLLQTAQLKLAELNQTIEHSHRHIESIVHYLKSVGASPDELKGTLDQSDYIYYTCMFEQKRPILVDEQGEELDLEGCPFEFEWKTKQGWVPVHYQGEGVFVSKDGTPYRIKENKKIRLKKIQLDPYYILRNELEKPALQSLEKSLAGLGISHDHMVHCHNSLLIKLLQSNGDAQQSFSGVNFIAYLSTQGMILVQHHYERKLVENGTDEIYDRFEFTSDSGKRSIITYTNEFSR